MTTLSFTYKDLSKPAADTYKAYIQAGKAVKKHTEIKRDNMKFTFARFGIAALILNKKDYQMFVSVFYLKDRKKNLMSDKSASVLKAFGNKAAGNNKDVDGFEGNAEMFVHDNGVISTDTLDLWLGVFEKLELKTWDDFRLFGVQTEDVKLSDAFLEIKENTISALTENVNHQETIDSFTDDIEAILLKAQKADDKKDIAADKADTKERKKAEAKQEIELLAAV